jgi:hypothetical protein
MDDELREMNRVRDVKLKMRFLIHRHHKGPGLSRRVAPGNAPAGI